MLTNAPVSSHTRRPARRTPVASKPADPTSPPPAL